MIMSNCLNDVVERIAVAFDKFFPQLLNSSVVFDFFFEELSYLPLGSVFHDGIDRHQPRANSRTLHLRRVISSIAEIINEPALMKIYCA